MIFHHMSQLTDTLGNSTFVRITLYDDGIHIKSIKDKTAINDYWFLNEIKLKCQLKRNKPGLVFYIKKNFHLLISDAFFFKQLKFRLKNNPNQINWKNVLHGALSALILSTVLILILKHYMN